jgi:hypothetical protein
MNWKSIFMIALATALCGQAVCEDLLVTKAGDEILGFKRGKKFKACTGEVISPIPKDATVKKTDDRCQSFIPPPAPPPPPPLPPPPPQ